jgi:predicted phosphodiesterase
MRIALLADIHANEPALAAVLADAKSREVDVYRHAGDIVGYGASPKRCWNMLSELGVSGTAGNHEDCMGIIHGDLQGDIPENASSCVLDPLRHAYRELGESRYTLIHLPRTIDEIIGGRRVFIVHGTPSNPLHEYFFMNVPVAEGMDDFDSSYREQAPELIKHAGGPDILVTAHTHDPGVMKRGDCLLVNPGSVGQPRDRNPRASYAILDTESADAEIIRVEYDIKAAAAAIRAAGFRDFYWERLFWGR